MRARHSGSLDPAAASDGTAVRRTRLMLTTPNKRFVWARAERFTDFSFFRTLLKRRRRPARILKGRAMSRPKPASWTPWLWMKPDSE
jgi:hypothetical protein